MRSRNLAVVFAGLLVSCGGSGDALAPEAGDLVAELRVTVRPEGSAGPERVRRVECAVLGEEAIDPRCRVLGGLGPRDLDPVPRRAACAQVYGGPGTAQVTGELRGVHVSAEFDLSDACEIARWRRNVALLGAPGVGHGGPQLVAEVVEWPFQRVRRYRLRGLSLVAAHQLSGLEDAAVERARSS